MDGEKKAWIDSLIGLGMHGGPFVKFAAHKIAGECDYSGVDIGMRADMLRSAFARHDRRAVVRMVKDWTTPRGRRTASVTKWVPGDHFYALDEKFDSLEAARSHLRKNGYEYEGLTETRMYHDGD